MIYLCILCLLHGNLGLARSHGQDRSIQHDCSDKMTVGNGNSWVWNENSMQQVWVFVAYLQVSLISLMHLQYQREALEYEMGEWD
jgi:hypothetical protein